MDVDLQLAKLESERAEHIHGSDEIMNIHFVRWEYYHAIQCLALCISVATMILALVILHHYRRHRPACARGLAQTRATLLTYLCSTSQSKTNTTPTMPAESTRRERGKGGVAHASAKTTSSHDSHASADKANGMHDTSTHQSMSFLMILVLGWLILCGVNATLMLMRYTAYRLYGKTDTAQNVAGAAWDLWSQVSHANKHVLVSWLCEYVSIACTYFYLVHDTNYNNSTPRQTTALGGPSVLAGSAPITSKAYIYGVLAAALSLFPSFYQSLQMRSDDPERGAVWTTHVAFLVSLYIFVALALPWMRNEYHMLLHSFYSHLDATLTRERQGMSELLAREKIHGS